MCMGTFDGAHWICPLNDHFHRPSFFELLNATYHVQDFSYNACFHCLMQEPIYGDNCRTSVANMTKIFDFYVECYIALKSLRRNVREWTEWGHSFQQRTLLEALSFLWFFQLKWQLQNWCVPTMPIHCRCLLQGWFSVVGTWTKRLYPLPNAMQGCWVLSIDCERGGDLIRLCALRHSRFASDSFRFHCRLL